MEDLNRMLELTETYPRELEQMTEEFLLKLKVILWGPAAMKDAANEKSKDLPATAAVSPQQTKKRVKRLSSLTEDTEAESSDKTSSKKSPSPRKSKRSNSELLATAEAVEDEVTTKVTVDIPVPVPAPRTQSCINEKDNKDMSNSNDIKKSNSLMPPPAAPVAAPSDETVNRRPQRAAKLKSEKNLKEPKLSTKLRRPTAAEEVKIKLEHEQRPSQIHEAKNNSSDGISKKKSTISSQSTANKASLESEKSDESVVVIPGKQPSIVSITSDVEDTVSTLTDTNSDSQENQKEQKKSFEAENGIREIRIKIKREKVSLSNEEEVPQAPLDDAIFKAPIALPLPLSVVKSDSSHVEDASMASSTLSSTTNTTTAGPVKKLRKKKDVVHRPIKVERFSDLDKKPSPVSSRTRNGSVTISKQNDSSPNDEVKRAASIYEDAVETPPSRHSKEVNNAAVTVGAFNETVNLGPANDAIVNLGSIPSDTTFNTNPAQTTFQVAPGQTTFTMEANHNATITLKKHSGALADATFDVPQISKTVKEKEEDIVGQGSFETALDSSMARNESILTEDDSCVQEKIMPGKTKVVASATKTVGGSLKTSSSAKALYKIPPRTNELFNPLAQSPVKMRVEAFENAAAAATEQSKRPLRSKKENLTPSSNTTPVIGKLTAPALGRFLTPTQSSNIATVSSAIAKKGTTSASKALPMPKSGSASSLQRSNSTASTKTLQRENSVDDFRKGLHSLAEERKKQREQKHLLAAQQREAKERERAERMAKLAKEREEKRLLKKQQEKEQKKKELEVMQRKLQQEEELAKLKAKEREMLLQMKQQQQLAKQKMMPPPPKVATKYTFEMLHEDDSTDDEDKVSYKRPPPPSWSRSQVRGPNMLRQEYTPSAYIDSFFSVQPMTPDLKVIFPNIDARHLKRNSSVLWSTPPRYSELPKY